jgi:hypothetical protein
MARPRGTPREPEPRGTVAPAEVERIRSQILRSVYAELRIRGGGEFYGYTKSSNDNYGKYEKE